MRLIFVSIVVSAWMPLAGLAQDNVQPPQAPFSAPIPDPAPVTQPTPSPPASAPATPYAPPSAPYAPPAPVAAPTPVAPAVVYAPPAPVTPAPIYAPPAPVTPAPIYLVPISQAPAVAPAVPGAQLSPSTPAMSDPSLPAPGKGDPGFVDRSKLPGGYVIAAGQVIKYTSPDDDPLQAVREAQLSSELTLALDQLDALQNQRVRLGPAITLMVFGFGASSVSALAAVSTFSKAESVQHGHLTGHDITGNGVVNGQDEQRYRNIAYGFTAAAVGGLVMGLTGLVKLARRRGERAANQARSEQLTGRIAAIREQLDYGVSFGPQQLQMGIQSNF
ncbi:MAG: hypothetical protein QM778_01040 [Myxococcales bacterium]